MTTTNSLLRLLFESEVRLIYARKDGTKGRYALTASPENVFPKTIGFTKEFFKKPTNRGRALAYISVGQVRGEFNKPEESPYKHPKAQRPRITFSVWRYDANSRVFGFADVGFAFGDAPSQIQTSNDLVVLVRPNNTKYTFEGFKDLSIIWNKETRFLKVEGSLAYTFYGHDFQFSPTDFKNSLRFVQDFVGVSLFDAHVLKFEAGTVLKIHFKPEAFLMAHQKIKGMKTKPFDHGKYFENQVLRFKIYDANRRIQQTLSKSCRNDLQTNFGYEPNANYIKIENHYKKPEIHFKQRPLLVTDLFKPDFQNQLKNDLLTTYQSTMKSTYTLPTTKKELSVSALYLLRLKQVENQFGLNVEEGLLALLKAIPEDVLTHGDRKHRRAKIREDLKRTQSNGTHKSPYDVSELLKENLGL